MKKIIRNSLDTHIVYLFMVTRETHLFGELLRDHFKCDFLVFKYELPLSAVRDDE